MQDIKNSTTYLVESGVVSVGGLHDNEVGRDVPVIQGPQEACSETHSIESAPSPVPSS